MNDRLDIVVIGLGPAGATLCRLLPDTLKVAALDKKHDGPDSFKKPCGGLLAPDAQKALARFDLTLPKEVLVDPQIFSVRTVDLDSLQTRHYQRFYLNLDRHAFDRWLISLIPDHVKVYPDSVALSIEREEGGWAVHCRLGDTVATLRTRMVIGADGARSLVRRTAYPNLKIREYLAVQQWFRDENPQPFYSCVFDSTATDCYSWALSKNGRFLFGGAYPIDSAKESLHRQKQALEERGFRFGEPLSTEACIVLRPRSFSEIRVGRNGLALIGEAGGFISPSSLEGISSAMETARLLSDAICRHPENPIPAYRKSTLKLRLKLAAKNLKCPFLYHPLLRALVLKSGLQAIDPYGADQ